MTAPIGRAADTPRQAVRGVGVAVAQVALMGVSAVQGAPVAAVEGRVPRGHGRVVVTHGLHLIYKNGDVCRVF